MTDNIIRWEQGSDGIVVLTMDAPRQSANTMSGDFLAELDRVVDRLEAEKETVTGVILASAKKSFFAGGDLTELIEAKPEDSDRYLDTSRRTKSTLRRLETLGRPVVAAVNGAALGGGLEIALACHRRVALDVRGSQIGLPEATLGLLPGAGGLVRTVRLLGISKALEKVLLQGQRYTPVEAKEIGLLDEIVESQEELLPAAKSWILQNPDACQPWDQPGYKMPGGTPKDPSFASGLVALPAVLRKQLKGAPMDAQRNIMCAAVEGARVDIENAFVIESRYFVELVTGQVAKNLIQALFFDTQSINAGGSRPAGYETWSATKAAVLGAGLMGAGIAYSCARAGVEVVLKDVSIEAAEKGKAYSARVLDKSVSRGKVTREEADAVLARIHPTADAVDLSGCDLVIEAVFEDPQVKKQVFAEIEGIVEPGCLLGSNTSTLPITELAEGVKGQENFVGLHFFSPVERMPLLEIVVGEQTSDEALAKAFDLARRLGKTPIVVNDSRGFFTSRVIRQFAQEALAMVGEGVAPSSIEQAALQAGYPAGPLSLLDDLTLTLMRKIVQETREGLAASGVELPEHPAYPVLDRMIDEFGRGGRPTGAGFYEYDGPGGRRQSLWPGLQDAFGGTSRPPLADLKERLLFSEALDAIRCLDEGVLRSVADANVGSILGIGFPAWTGGVLQYVNQYHGGLAGFVARARELAERYGDRFVPPDSVISRAEAGQRYV